MHCDRLRTGRIPDPEADSHRQRDVLADLCEPTRDVIGIEIPRARHALQRDVIDIARGNLRDRCDARIRRCRRQEEDRGHFTRSEQRGEFRRFLGRIVDYEDAIHAGVLRAVRERGDAHRLDRVGVAHEDHGRGRIARAKIAHHGEHVGQAHALRQRALAGTLDHRPVGHRIGKRNAELDDVGAIGDQRFHDAARRGERRVASRDERDQRSAPGRPPRRECGVDSIQCRTRSFSAAPDRIPAGRRI